MTQTSTDNPYHHRVRLFDTSPQGLAERQSQGKRAAGEAAKIRESYRGKGDDLMSEFERNRRLEAEARRRAGSCDTVHHA